MRNGGPRIVQILVVLSLSSASILAGNDQCDRILIEGTVLKMVDLDPNGAWTFPIEYRENAESADYASVLKAEECARDAWILLGDVRAVEPGNCPVPDRVLLDVKGLRGWRARIDEDGLCRSVGPFFTSRWKVGMRVYALAFPPGVRMNVACFESRCESPGGPTAEEQGAGAVSWVTWPRPDHPVLWLSCDAEMAEILSSTDQMCALQESLILVLPARRFHAEDMRKSLFVGP